MKTFIVCDLDNCLIKTDLLYEHWLLLLKSKPLTWLLSPFWLLFGRAYFKFRLAEHVSMAAHTLPYREVVLDYLKTAKGNRNSELILASASPSLWTNTVSQHLGFFDHAVGSSKQENLKGVAKLKAIQKITNGAEFTYIGDAQIDLEIWKSSSAIVGVNVSSSLRAKISTLRKPTDFIYDKNKTAILISLIRQMRPHQWIKNGLVFLPAFAGHKLFSPEAILQCIFAFAGFSLAASFVYVLNDLLDLKSDRSHHSKKSRPFASGDLSVKWGLLLLPGLLAGAFGFASLLPVDYSLWITFYLILNLAYSLYLKQSVVVDVIVLSIMYTLRIFAGSAATAVPVSDWLLNFSTLFFFSLACVKRYTEIVRSKNKITIDGRGYRQVDHTMMQALGVGTGLLSILIVLLYLRSNEVRALYSNPQNLWFITPVLLFWISRLWILTNRDEIHDDPVVFAVKDKISWVCLIILAAVFGFST